MLGLHWWLSGKESTCQFRRHGFDPWVGKFPCKKKWQPTPVFVSGNFHWQRSLMGYSPWDCKGVGHKLATEQQQQWMLMSGVQSLPCMFLPSFPLALLSPSFHLSSHSHWAPCVWISNVAMNTEMNPAWTLPSGNLKQSRGRSYALINTGNFRMQSRGQWRRRRQWRRMRLRTCAGGATEAPAGHAAESAHLLFPEHLLWSNYTSQFWHTQKLLWLVFKELLISTHEV